MSRIAFRQLQDGLQSISDSGIITLEANSIFRIDTSTISNIKDIVNKEYVDNLISSNSTIYNADDSLTSNRILSGSSLYGLTLTDLTNFNINLTGIAFDLNSTGILLSNSTSQTQIFLILVQVM